MSPDGEPILGPIILLVILIALHAYLAAAHTAMESVSRNNIRALAEEGNSKAKAVLSTAEEPYKYLLAIETTVTFIKLFMSAYVAWYLSSYIFNRLQQDAVPYYHAIGLIVCAILLCFFLLLFGMILPRRIGLLYADKIAMSSYRKARLLALVFKPLAAAVGGIVVLILKIFRQRTDVTEAKYSEDEVVSMLESGQESGELKEEGMKMITSIFAFDDMLAYEVMTPRTDVFSIDINEPSEEYIDELMELRYSRIPVYEDDSDNIIGILYIKDYLIKAREDGFDNVDIRSILRKPYFVPETKKIDTLFVELQQTKQHIAILIDEYGGFSGIVTMEDIIEEVMGDIDDEYDEVEPEIQKLSNNIFIIDGSMDIDDVDEELGIDLKSDNSETIGGFIIDILGEIPDDDDIGSVVEFENYKFRIDSIRDRRIEQIHRTIEPREEYEDGQEQADLI